MKTNPYTSFITMGKYGGLPIKKTSGDPKSSEANKN